MKALQRWPWFLLGMVIIATAAVFFSHTQHQSWRDSLELAASILPVPILSFAVVRWDYKQEAVQEAAKPSSPPE